MIEIDCSMGEGGGAIIRAATALATLTERTITLKNIRKKRPNPGLQAQHIESLKALQQLTGVKIEGLKLGNSMIRMTKPTIRGTECQVKIPTAGNIPLLIQAIMYYSLGRSEKIKLIVEGGATHSKWAPTIEFIDLVTHKIIEKMGGKIDINVKNYGFYPKGGAKCEIVYAKKAKLQAIELIKQGKLKETLAISVASKNLSERKVAERQLESFRKGYQEKSLVNPILKYVNTLSPGSALTIVNKYEKGGIKGFSTIGERGISAESIGSMALSHFGKLNIETSIDSYAADQLIVPIALAKGKSCITTDIISNHTKTNIEVVKRILDIQIEVERTESGFKIIKHQ